MDASELSQLMARNVDSVVQHLLPGGKRIGREWSVGSISGEAGKSLKVHLEGPKAGVWQDFATSDGGDLLDLWKAVRGVSLSTAIQEAKAYFGIRETKFEKVAPVRFTRPKKPDCQPPYGNVLQYLTQVRKLSASTIGAYKVAATPDDTTIVLPSLRGDELLAIKYLKVKRDNGKKVSWTEKDTEPCLFGWQAVPEDTRTLIITEGELDAMSLFEYGFPAVSVPYGAGNHQWVENEFEHLDRFSEILICFDVDEPGQKGAVEIANRLGLHRCRLVTLYEKDANACLQAGIPREIMEKALVNARALDPVELKRPPEFSQEVTEEFYPVTNSPKGIALPWTKTESIIRLRPDELTLWAGYNGHGKSQLLGHVMLNAAKQGERICIASLEIKPKKLLYRMIRQLTAVAVPSRAEINQALNWMNHKFWLFDLVGTAKVDRLLEVFKYARRRYGVTQFVIDSLLKCGIAEDDYKNQKLFVEKLCDFKNQFDCHVHLVTHSRKGESEFKEVGKLDIRGSGAISDLADNVFIVWRNKPKEEAIQAGDKTYDTLAMSDAFLTCTKQRNGEWEGKVALWFDKASFQYLGAAGEPPVNTYLGLGAVTAEEPL